MQFQNFARRTFLTGLLLVVISGAAWSQTEPIEGIRENTPQVHALTNARVVQAPGRVIERGTIVIRDGTIEAVGDGVAIPKDARIWDYSGMTIYAGLIEPYSQIGLPKPKNGGDNSDEGGNGASHWNSNVHPEVTAVDNFKPKESDLESLRSLGFTAALISPNHAILAGSAALMSLRAGDINEQVIRDNVAQSVLFQRPRSAGRGSYPNSQMGVIALLRQTLLDAKWYRQAHQAYAANPNQERPETNEALAALNATARGRQPVVMEVSDDLNALRAIKLGKEFGLKTWIVGSGHEYRQIDAIKASGVPFILTVDFPETPNVDSPEDALEVSLTELSHWDMAPANASELHKAGIPFAFSTHSLKKSADFRKKIQSAIKRGLNEDAALEALTVQPARLLGVAGQLGTIDRGKLAHLVVTDGPLFGEKTTLFDVWVDGHRFVVEEKPEIDPRGVWQLTLNLPDKEMSGLKISLEGEVKKLKGRIEQDSTKTEFKKLEVDHRRFTATFPGDSLGFDGIVQVSGTMTSDGLSGHGMLPDGSRFTWRAGSRQEAEEDKEDKDDKEDKSEEVAETDEAPLFPKGAYAYRKSPEQPKHVLVQGVTIWTSGPDGKLENADMLVTNGKITHIGKGLNAPDGAVVIDGTDKHITPGLIDAHSHTGIDQGVNESTQAVTAEVGIGDVVDNNDVGWYRELAGGLTAANQLHGSANPIGGKNSVVKLRWGSSPDEMKIADAIPGIKFALGENVKQSNWGDRYTSRYPQTRMGVEQIIRDRFRAAQDYEKQWNTYNSTKNKKGVIPPRRDLELETMLEILRGERLVHSHSYRQDEILMLVRIADDFGFTIGTFQHVLEGYKIAEALAKHGAGASTFSDWWAYKFEVYDAIPYNGALMHDVGVVVSFNSDSGELARRMNLEAAKAVKYGGLSEEEALKFVTLNPAKQLRVDHRIGSLENGKDADFVVWSGNPLSTLTKCEQTWIDGRKYFDLEEDKKMQQQVMAERARLIQKALNGGAKKKSEKEKKEPKPTLTLNEPEAGK